MKINELTEHYSSHPLMRSLVETVNDGHAGKIRIEGLSDSARSIVMSVVFNKSQITHLIVLPEKEDAAYLYNDLISSIGEESVSFFLQHTSVQYSMSRPNQQILYCGRKF
jgi:transcription-repair coupling factor (superfamily II helicase)